MVSWTSPLCDNCGGLVPLLIPIPTPHHTAEHLKEAGMSLFITHPIFVIVLKGVNMIKHQPPLLQPAPIITLQTL